MSSPVSPISRRRLLAYGLPGLALALPTIPAYVLLPAFYAETVGLGLAATGAVLLLARLLDGLTDPLIGLLSDRLHLPLGRRKPWIMAGAAIAGPSLLQLFSPPDGAGAGYLLLWSALLYLGWTLIQIPYTAWGAELSDDYHQRSRIAASREGLMLFGILAAGAAPVIADALGFSQREGLHGVAWAAVLFGAPALLLLVVTVPERRQAKAPGPIDWRGLTANKPFLRLLGAWFINGLANGLPAVLFPLYLTHALDVGEALKGALILGYFATAILAMPLWLHLSRQIGKHRSWCVAMLVACAAFLSVPWIGAGEWETFLIVCIITGAALGADLALPPAMQADVIDWDTLRHGYPRAGIYFALWSMAGKLALALAVGIAFPVLDLLNFTPEGDTLPLVLIYAVVPVVLKSVAVVIVWSHPLTRARHDIIRRRLSHREERTHAPPSSGSPFGGPSVDGMHIHEA